MMAEPRRSSLEEAEAICRQAGARLTRLRRQVLGVLLEAEGPGYRL
jgi:Fe2+ or Zn2+ uptake regulation protein